MFVQGHHAHWLVASVFIFQNVCSFQVTAGNICQMFLTCRMRLHQADCREIFAQFTYLINSIPNTMRYIWGHYKQIFPTAGHSWCHELEWTASVFQFYHVMNKLYSGTHSLKAHIVSDHKYKSKGLSSNIVKTTYTHPPTYEHQTFHGLIQHLPMTVQIFGYPHKHRHPILEMLIICWN